LQRAKIARRITGLPIAKGGTHLNHLYFADDSLFFCKANIVEWMCIQEILELYEKALRQKSSLFFSRNTKPKTKAFITSVVGVSST
jgi:hypothetical protein